MQSKKASTRHPNEKRSRRRAARIFAILVALSAATTALPGTAADATPAGHNPTGTLGVHTSGHRIHIYGAASDPDTAHSIKVIYYINGTPREVDIAGPHHVYDRVLAPRYGTYRVTVVAHNYGPGSNTVLGTKIVKLVNPATRNPRGNAHLSNSGRTLKVKGTAYDPDRFHSGAVVRVFDNGHKIGAAWSNSRTHRYGIMGRLQYGTNRLAVVVYNQGPGNRNPVVRRASIIVPEPWISRYHGAQAIAARMLAKHGWGASQMPPLVNLWNRESGWNTHAMNPSGAYGIPQALPGSKMAMAGPDWQSSASTQIAWGLNYIAATYGSPSAAWAHSQSHGWY